MLTLSPSAVEAVDSLLHQPDMPDEAGLRISAAPDSQLTVQIVPEPAPGDQIIENGGARVFVDSDAAPIVDRTELNARLEGDRLAFQLTPAGSNNGSPSGG